MGDGLYSCECTSARNIILVLEKKLRKERLAIIVLTSIGVGGEGNGDSYIIHKILFPVVRYVSIQKRWL